MVRRPGARGMMVDAAVRNVGESCVAPAGVMTGVPRNVVDHRAVGFGICLVRATSLVSRAAGGGDGRGREVSTFVRDA